MYKIRTKQKCINQYIIIKKKNQIYKPENLVLDNKYRCVENYS